MNQYDEDCTSCIYYEHGCIIGKCHPNCKEKIIKKVVKNKNENYNKFL